MKHVLRAKIQKHLENLNDGYEVVLNNVLSDTNNLLSYFNGNEDITNEIKVNKNLIEDLLSENKRQHEIPDIKSILNEIQINGFESYYLKQEEQFIDKYALNNDIADLITNNVNLLQNYIISNNKDLFNFSDFKSIVHTIDLPILYFINDVVLKNELFDKEKVADFFENTLPIINGYTSSLDNKGIYYLFDNVYKNKFNILDILGKDGNLLNKSILNIIDYTSQLYNKLDAIDANIINDKISYSHADKNGNKHEYEDTSLVLKIFFTLQSMGLNDEEEKMVIRDIFNKNKINSISNLITLTNFISGCNDYNEFKRIHSLFNSLDKDILFSKDFFNKSIEINQNNSNLNPSEYLNLLHTNKSVVEINVIDKYYDFFKDFDIYNDNNVSRLANIVSIVEQTMDDVSINKLLNKYYVDDLSDFNKKFLHLINLDANITFKEGILSLINNDELFYKV